METNRFFDHFSLSSSQKEKCCRQNLQRNLKHVLFSIFFFFENPSVYEIMWKNIVERSRQQMTIWRMRIACWIPTATNTKADCVILFDFPL
jgi:hypothetical protein